MHTTTVRFDADTWARICREAERLGVPRAAFIRDAARAETVRAENGRELCELASRVERVEHGLRVISAYLRRHPSTRR